MNSPDGNIMALDVGRSRIGVALADPASGLPQPFGVIKTEEFETKIKNLITDKDISAIVVGMPRGLDGQSTEQTQYTQGFIARLKSQVSLPLYEQDEALTSLKAEEELKARKKPYAKADIDALAATYILDDFLKDQSL